MNTKIIIGVVVVLVIIGGLYFVMKGTAGAPAQSTTATSTSASATTTDQVQGQDVTVGTGAAATPGSLVSVLYVGKLQDGTVFDSSAAHGNKPLDFTLGSKDLIAGFQIGVNGMKVGGERLLSIPPTLGYGTQDVKDPTSGKVIIPANSTLIFDVKLVSVKAGTPASAATPGQ